MTTNHPVLYGRLLSPYVRRVAVTLNLYGIEFEQKVVSAVGDEVEREAINPVGRVPAFQLSSGEVLIDSAAILDHLDELAGKEKSLMPLAGPARRYALRRLAIATGAIDRAMTANAERRRPATQHDAARLDRLLRQARQGFEELDRDLAGKDFFDGERLGQPDVTSLIGFAFVNHIFPGTLPDKRFPNLARRSKACELTLPFGAAKIG
jgi:glutathione S-transferase